MPITYGTFTKQMKLLPLTLAANGGATVTVRFGFVNGESDFVSSEESVFNFTPEAVSSILDIQPTPGLTRRDDLSYAIYTYLVTNGLIPAGDIT